MSLCINILSDSQFMETSDIDTAIKNYCDHYYKIGSGNIHITTKYEDLVWFVLVGFYSI